MSDAQARATHLRSRITKLVPDIPHLNYKDLVKHETALLIDVRTPSEIAQGTLPNALPLASLPTPLPPVPLVTFCTVGLRSAAVALRLRRMHSPDVFNYSLMEHLWGGGELCRPDGKVWEGDVHVFAERYARVFPDHVGKVSFRGWEIVSNALPAVPGLMRLFAAWAWRSVIGSPDSRDQGMDAVR